LLGDPPPPPPPAVPTLAEDDQTGERQSLKDKLIAHRESEACMNCHRKIDPWGIAFENYNGIGVWRDSTVTEVGDAPAAINQPQPLGRYLEFTDTESVKNLTSDFREDEYRLKDLIVAIVLSEPFRLRLR
jgi:hypothetical protein